MARKAGRPKIVWTSKEFAQFENMCFVQCTLEEIEFVMNIDRKTIYRLCKEHYKDKDGNPLDFSTVYKKYSEGGRWSLRRYQMESAKKGNVTMQIWLGKQWLGQSDKQDIEISEEKDYVFNIIPASKNKGD